MQHLNVDELNKITEAIIGAAIEVHRQLGPGLLESAYRACLRYELLERGYVALQEVPLPLTYKGLKLDCGYRLDLLVNDAAIVEVKSVSDLAPVHEAQLLSYLKISGANWVCCLTSMSSSSNMAALSDSLIKYIKNPCALREFCG